MTAVRAHAAANDSITTAREPASPATPKRLPAAPARCNSSLVSALASSSSLRTSACSSLVTSPSSWPTDRSSSTRVAIGTPRTRGTAPQQPTRHEAGGRAAQQERARTTARELLHVVDHPVDTALVQPVRNPSHLIAGPSHVVGNIAGLVDATSGQSFCLVAHPADGVGHLVGLRATLVAQLALGLVDQAAGLRRDFVLDLARLLFGRFANLRRLGRRTLRRLLALLPWCVGPDTGLAPIAIAHDHPPPQRVRSGARRAPPLGETCPELIASKPRRPSITRSGVSPLP